MLILSVVMVLTCTGCGSLTGDVDDLLSIPKIASEFSQLQEEIDKIMDASSEYAAPIGGANRQSVQLVDLNSDGVQEALVFTRTTHENPLKLCLISAVDGGYALKAEEELSGLNFTYVGYYDLNGDGLQEIIVGRTMGTGLSKAISVYTVNDDGFYELLSSTFTGYTVLDLNRDDQPELVMIRKNQSDLINTVEVYKYLISENALVLENSSQLSAGIDSVKLIKTGNLIDDIPAVFITSQYQTDSLITDIFAYREGKLENIALDKWTGVSREIIRNYSVYGSDIDSDGVFELPKVVEVEPYESMRSSSTFYKIIWRRYSLWGAALDAMQTYHNYFDGWYFILPESWSNAVTIDRRDYVSGERTIVFSLFYRNLPEPIDALSIFTLTGDNKHDRLAIADRFQISNSSTRRASGSAIYAAYLYNLPASMSVYDIDKSYVIDSFRLISTDWLTEELIS